VLATWAGYCGKDLSGSRRNLARQVMLSPSQPMPNLSLREPTGGVHGPAESRARLVLAPISAGTEKGELAGGLSARLASVASEVSGVCRPVLRFVKCRVFRCPNWVMAAKDPHFGTDLTWYPILTGLDSIESRH
jgi:hypothetical protein